MCFIFYSPADHLMRQREKAQQERAKLIKKNQEKQNQPRNVGFPQLRRVSWSNLFVLQNIILFYPKES